MFLNDGDFKAAIVTLVIIAGTVGWGVIEGALWLFSFVNISFGG